jgi:hypothetical protein
MDTLARRVRRNNFAEADAGLQWKDLLRPVARTTLVSKTANLISRQRPAILL